MYHHQEQQNNQKYLWAQLIKSISLHKLMGSYNFLSSKVNRISTIYLSYCVDLIRKCSFQFSNVVYKPAIL